MSGVCVVLMFVGVANRAGFGGAFSGIDAVSPICFDAVGTSVGLICGLTDAVVLFNTPPNGKPMDGEPVTAGLAPKKDALVAATLNVPVDESTFEVDLSVENPKDDCDLSLDNGLVSMVFATGIEDGTDCGEPKLTCPIGNACLVAIGCTLACDVGSIGFGFVNAFCFANSSCLASSSCLAFFSADSISIFFNLSFSIWALAERKEDQQSFIFEIVNKLNSKSITVSNFFFNDYLRIQSFSIWA